mmetsp:Transcript_8571/g.31665  ORF Transcript_8571/g.31665 Transcript_8571/m.31665 type:complete len:340 (+) Transcript_8571:156-1175(+)
MVQSTLLLVWLVWIEMFFCGVVADKVVPAIAKRLNLQTSHHSEYTKFTKYSSFLVAVPSFISIQNTHVHPVFTASAILNVSILTSSLLFHWGHATYHSLANAKAELEKALTLRMEELAEEISEAFPKTLEAYQGAREKLDTLTDEITNSFPRTTHSYARLCSSLSRTEEALEARLGEITHEVAEAFPRTRNAYRRSILTLTNTSTTASPSPRKPLAQSRSSQLLIAEEGTDEAGPKSPVQWLPSSTLLQLLHIIDRVLVAAGTIFHILLGTYLEAELGLRLLAVALLVYPLGFIDGRFHVVFHGLGMTCISAIVYGSARNFETGDFRHLFASASVWQTV